MGFDGATKVIINAGAGLGARMDVLHGLTEILARDSGWHIVIARSGAEVLKLAESAANGDCQIVVAAGGDGTISTVANALAGTSKALGVLPIGTLNHFAKDLRLPLDLEGAIRTIRSGRVIDIDVGEVNGQRFINNSSLGLYPSILNQRAKNQLLGLGKWPAFVWAAFQMFRRYRLLDLKLITGGGVLECRTPFVFVGNNQYEMEGFKIGGRKHLDAGELSLYMTNHTGRLALGRLALRGLIGGLWREKDFTATTTRELWIATRHQGLHVATDGEVAVMQPPLHYRILPKALKVIVPRNEE